MPLQKVVALDTLTSAIVTLRVAAAAVAILERNQASVATSTIAVEFGVPRKSEQQTDQIHRTSSPGRAVNLKPPVPINRVKNREPNIFAKGEHQGVPTARHHY